MQTDLDQITRIIQKLDTRQRAHALIALRALVAGERADDLIDACRCIAKTTPADRFRKR